jgi:NADPH:quinone reductase-like Zn-dependent oxidoreductase
MLAMVTIVKEEGIMMKAIRLNKYGGAEELSYDDVVLPTIGPTQVLVKVHAASVNPIDYKLASGMMRDLVKLTFPWMPGGDFSGVVGSYGSKVTGIKKGDAVFGNSPGGGAYSQHIAASADLITAKPTTLDHFQAASVPLAAQTAWQGLFDHGELKAGQRVLIHGAAGGVGTFAVQLAHWKGAEVFATSISADMEYLSDLGADEVINYKAVHFEDAAKDMDLVFDLIGGDTQTRSFTVLKPGGRLISTVEPPSPEEAGKKNIFAMVMRMQPTAKRLAILADLLDKGKIKTIVDKTFALSQAADAWRHIVKSHSRGKIVLVIPL